jgi:hypothetical protein
LEVISSVAHLPSVAAIVREISLECFKLQVQSVVVAIDHETAPSPAVPEESGDSIVQVMHLLKLLSRQLAGLKQVE